MNKENFGLYSLFISLFRNLQSIQEGFSGLKIIIKYENKSICVVTHLAIIQDPRATQSSLVPDLYGSSHEKNEMEVNQIGCK